MAFASLLVLAGCATAPVTMSYQPTSPARRISGEKPPKVFLSAIEDKNPLVTPIFSFHRGRLTTPFDAGLREALTTELRRLGFETPSGPALADATLNVSVSTKKMEISGDKRERTDRWFLRTTLAMTLSLIGKDGRQLWTGDLSGRGDNENAPNGYSPSSSFSTSLNEALADAVGKLGRILEEDMVVSLISPASSPRPAPRADPGRPATPSAPAKEAPERVVRSDIDDLPARSIAAKPNAHAVVIGVRRYRQKLPEADFADSDARLVSRYLTQVLGYQAENVAVLIDDQAQKSDFEKYFEQWLPNRVEKGEEVFVYFSGHGAPNPTTGDAYLVPFDGDPTYLSETAYPLKKMYAALARLPAKRTAVVMDSCFSGAGGRSVLAKGAKPLVNRLSSDVVPANISVLTASAGDQITYAYEEKGHGLFTYFLLKGIKEGRGDGGADLKGVFDYAAPLVSRIARREFNNDQVPQWQGNAR